MSPIEVEYGRLVKVGDEVTFVHDDTNEPLVVHPGKNLSVIYERTDGWLNGLCLSIQVMADSKDNGGAVSYNVRNGLLGLVKASTIEKGQVVITPGEGESVTRKVSHRKRASLTVGFKARYVKSKV